MAKTYDLKCRHCDTINRVTPEKVLWRKKSPTCGACKKSLFLGEDEPFTDIHPDTYGHPLDQKALQSVRKIPGLKKIFTIIFKESFERGERMRHFASFIKASSTQIPDVARLYDKAVAKLDVERVPDLFVYQSPFPNAYTMGVDEPIIAVSTELIDLMEEDELMGVMAHELAHWESGHVLYKMAVKLVLTLGAQLMSSFLGLGSLAIIPIRLALLEWDRCSELTADRAELIATGSLDCSLRTLMKLASGSQKIYKQLSVEQFVEQAKAFRDMEEEHLLNKLASLMQSVQRTHPYPVWRAYHLMKWAESDEFFEIMAGRYQHRDGADLHAERDKPDVDAEDEGVVGSIKKLLDDFGKKD